MENKTFYFYSKPDKGCKRVTIAGVIVENELHIGMSSCSIKDQFERKKGRLIAEGRAIKKPIIIIPIQDKETTAKLFVKTAVEITENK